MTKIIDRITQGEWIVYKDLTSVWVTNNNTENTSWIAECVIVGGDEVNHNTTEQLSNAKLIAYAPKLLKIIEKIITTISEPTQEQIDIIIYTNSILYYLNSTK